MIHFNFLMSGELDNPPAFNHLFLINNLIKNTVLWMKFETLTDIDWCK